MAKKRMTKLLKKIINKFLTILGGKPEISKTREISTMPIRETVPPFVRQLADQGKPIVDSLKCPYCFSQKFVRRGWRQKKLERVQLYSCQECGRTFTARMTKGKHYPLEAIFDALSTYNLGYSLEETCRIVNHASEIPVSISAATLSNWLGEFSDKCRFLRMREFAIKKYSPKDLPAGRQGMVITATLAHRQLYRYRFHQAKCELMIKEEFQHRKFEPLKEFLEMVPGECPHQYFMEGLRASEVPLTFSKKQMIVRSKQNYATQLAEFVLQSVKNRALRHEALQKFMLYNDSVTVATEVPVYITKDDLEHLKTQLGFEIYNKEKSETQNPKHEMVRQAHHPERSRGTNSNFQISDLPKLITGHIDILQIRNGQIHILDYKANAEKEQPIEQLTLYAMALSRLTGLRMFEFKCAWFDEKDYFEFYPLHVIHKPRKSQRRRKVYTMEGTYKINENPKKIERIRPIA